MNGLIDFHSHVLPGIDDGSRCLEESVTMLRMLSRQGVRRVVATPHFYPNQDAPDRFLARRAKAEAQLREEMEKYPDLPELSIGAEVYYYSGISSSDQLEKLTIDGGNCLLLEMPTSPWTERMYEEIEAIRDRQGLTPIIAHVDRYISPLRTCGIPGRLAEMPVLVQANAGFFLRRSTGAMAMRMLKKGQIHLLGSDCHNPVSRPPRLGEAVDKIRSRLGAEALERLEKYQKLALETVTE